jgi:hypothetical protein
MQQAMQTEIEDLCETIEDCYEFTLSYAAKGVAADEGSTLGQQLREKLTGAVDAMRGLEGAGAALLKTGQLASAEKYSAFFHVMARDAQSAAAAMELVLVQPLIGAQLIDNLNASIHLRALLTDLFLVTEILSQRQVLAKPIAAE